MKLANLVLQDSVIRRRHDLFATAGGGQTTLRHQAAPGEQLVRGNAMPASNQVHRHARLEGLLDTKLLRRRPAPDALNRGDDFDTRRSGILNCTPF